MTAVAIPYKSDIEFYIREYAIKKHVEFRDIDINEDPERGETRLAFSLKAKKTETRISMNSLLQNLGADDIFYAPPFDLFIAHYCWKRGRNAPAPDPCAGKREEGADV